MDKPNERPPLHGVIDGMREGISAAFTSLGYPNVSFVLVAQDHDTMNGGMSANVPNEGAQMLLEVAQQELEKGRKKIVSQ
jgi:hypothetical protein